MIFLNDKISVTLINQEGEMQFKELRKQAGATQVALAKKLGITQSALAMWETGKSKPKTADIPKIASVLNVPVECVLECFTTEMKKAE